MSHVSRGQNILFIFCKPTKLGLIKMCQYDYQSFGLFFPELHYAAISSNWCFEEKNEVSSLWSNKQLAWTQNQISGKVWQREDLKIPNQNGNNFLLTSILSLKISELWLLVIFWKDIPTCPAFSGEIKVFYERCFLS